MITGTGVSKRRIARLPACSKRFWGHGDSGVLKSVTRREDPQHFFTTPQISELAEAIAGIEQKTSGQMAIYIEFCCPMNEPLSRAIQLFFKLGLDAARNHNGTLIYLATRDKLFAILGDRELNEKVPKNFWFQLKSAMEECFARNALMEGMLVAIHQVGERLCASFPLVPAVK
jgi:uncharacterized membrane protein